MSSITTWSDAINSAITEEERDLWLFFIWRPRVHQEFVASISPIIYRRLATLESWKTLSPEEIAYLALAVAYKSPDYDIKHALNKSIVQELAIYQNALWNYIWGQFSEEEGNFFLRDFIPRLRQDHWKLIPIYHTHSSEIFALKIAYDSLKKNIASNWLKEKILFSLVCVELMKLWMRPYILDGWIDPESKVDWITIFDYVLWGFEDKILDNACESGLLSLVWPIMQERKYLMDIKNSAIKEKTWTGYATTRAEQEAQERASNILRNMRKK